MLNTKFKLGKAELYFNWYDIAFQKKLVAATDKYVERVQSVKESDGTQKSELAAMEKLAQYTELFFDAVWGDGTAQQVFEGRRALDEMLDAVAKIEPIKDAQIAAFNKAAERIENLAGSNDKA